MHKIDGISVSTGIAIGKAHLIKERAFIISDHLIDVSEVTGELEHFRHSLETVIKEIEEYQQNFDLTEDDRSIIETHKMILSDPDFHLAIENMVAKDKTNLEQAVHLHFSRAIDYFQSLENELYAERAADYEDVYHRLMMQLKKIDNSMIDDVCAGEIVVMTDVAPSIVSQLHKRQVAGIILAKGTKTAHSIIIAKALGLPIITGVKHHPHIRTGDTMIIDAKKGFVIVNPPDSVYAEFVALQDKIRLEADALSAYIDLLPTSANAEQLHILSNIDLPIEIDNVLEIKSDGVGLFRTEFFYMNRENLPSEEEQFIEYKTMAEKLSNKPITIRTIDIGGDKVSGWYNTDREDNPNLGCRGIRFSLRYKNIFKTQLRAILRASHYGRLQIMFPMIATVEEFIEAKKVVAECQSELEREQSPYDKNIPIGTMIETPAAAICTNALAKHSDFFSIGTNDLLQYTVAVDRNNEHIAHYYNPYNPGFLYLVLNTIKTANQYNIPISICGELAADTNFTAFFLNAGVKELSVGIEHTLGLKKYIRSIDSQQAIPFIDELYKCHTVDETKRYIGKINNISTIH